MAQSGPQPSQEAIRAKLTTLLESVRAKRASLAEMTNDNDKANYIKIIANRLNIILNNNQITSILKDPNITADEILRLAEIPANPNTVLATEIALATAAAAATVYAPNISGGILSNFALRKIAHNLFDKQLGIYKRAIDLGLFVADFGMGTYSVRSLSAATISQLEETYGSPLCIAAVPAAMILYHKGPAILAAIDDSEVIETAGDFFDLMHGMADNDVYDKYHGSLATMTIDEMASSVMNGVGSTLSWLWSKTPSLRRQESTLLALPDTPSSTTSSSSLRRH